MSLQRSYSSPSDYSYQAYFFGSFRLLREGKAVEKIVWRRNKAKSILKWFLLNPGHPYSSTQLVHLFWQDTDQELALRSLYVTLHYLRHLIEPDLSSHQQSRYLRRDKNNVYWLERDATWWADIYELDDWHQSAKRLEHEGQLYQAISYYHKIINTCSNGFLPEDQYDDAFKPYHQHYDTMYLFALEHLIHLYLQTSMYDEALITAHKALHIDPYSETAMCAIANAYSNTGNVMKAMDRLNGYQRFLEEEAFIRPSEKFFSLKRQLAQQHE